jgi:hypothetical protein
VTVVGTLPVSVQTAVSVPIVVAPPPPSPPPPSPPPPREPPAAPQRPTEPPSTLCSWSVWRLAPGDGGGGHARATEGW